MNLKKIIVAAFLSSLFALTVFQTNRAHAAILAQGDLQPDTWQYENTRAGEGTSQKTFTLTKVGGYLPLAILSTSLGQETGFDILTDDCTGNQLNDVGDSCDVVVQFSPDARGLYSASLIMKSISREIIDSSAISGLGVAPEVQLIPPEVDFGDQTINTSSLGSEITLKNTGDDVLNIASITVTAATFGQTNDCAETLEPYDYCTILAVFSPTELGEVTEFIVIDDDASGNPHNVRLDGNGIAAGQPDLSMSATKIDFGTQIVDTSSTPKVVTLKNIGGAVLNFTSIEISDQFDLTNACGAALNIDSTCTLSIAFSPTSAGEKTGTITLTDNATDSPQTIALTGTGIVPDTPYVSLSANSLTFGEIVVDQSSGEQTVTLTNTGTAPLTAGISSIVSDASHSFSSRDQCYGNVIGIGESCTIGVIFKPSEDGALTAVLQIVNDATDSPQIVTLSGTGIPAESGGGCSLIIR